VPQATSDFSKSAYDEMAWLSRAACAPRLRSMAQFAEDEIILPNGPRAGLHLRLDTNPWLKAYLNEIDSGRWSQFNLTGGRQGGKTLGGSQLPLEYHLFEIGEPVIYAVPDMDLAHYKWDNDIKPVIMRSRYRDLLPSSGKGSKGGQFNEIEFLNGARLFFMTGGGGDAGRAGRTARVVVVTETDKMDSASGGSDETDKISQIIHCTDAFGDRRRIYMECTLTTKLGRTWREYESGTASRMALRCPKCAAYVMPEREHLQGWQGAETEIDAMERAYYACPACGAPWTEAERYEANLKAVIVHRGQEVTPEGKVTGPLPRTRTFSFRWNAVNNMFMPAGMVAIDEWNLSRLESEEALELKEKEVLQYLWAMPYEDEASKIEYLDSKAILSRPQSYKRGEIPDWAKWLTVGADVGKHAIHWTAIAWNEEARGQVIDYGVAEVHGKEMDENRAVYNALARIKEDYLDQGWLSADGKRKTPDAVLIDSRWQTAAVRQFVKEVNGKYWATLGFGATQAWRGGSSYRAPSKQSKTIPIIGDHYHIELNMSEGMRTVKINVDHWKICVQHSLETPAGEPGSLGLFQVLHSKEHLAYSKHITAEREVTEFVPGKGNVKRMEVVSRNNHWLDSTVLACVGGHMVGARVIGRRVVVEIQKKPEAIKPRLSGGFMGDNRPYLVTER
jgi:hypothetical protein